MNKRSIELEWRAEILPRDYKRMRRKIEFLGSLHSHTKRLSAMFFGKIKNRKIDIRVRITNGKSEIVVKIGAFGSYDRIEISQDIDSSQFIGMVKIFSQFGFSVEIGERETFNYILPNNIIVSLVSAGRIAYIELEKMSSKSDLAKNNEQLKKIADQLGLKIIESEKKFNALCKRLSETVDWSFYCTNNEYAKLTRLVKRYTNV